MYDQSFAVNVKGSLIVAIEAKRMCEAQKSPGSLVIAMSVNGAVPKYGD
jgi:NAD(P)-dependent dehydrogenase (short-subunit alcohol dehydrogenase family)